MSKTNPARGMRDFLPADMRKREYVIDIIKEVYESYGYEPLETPAVENIETLMGKYGEEGNQLIFKILKRGEKLGGGLKRIWDPTIRTIVNEAKLESKILGETLESALQRAMNIELIDLALRYDLTVPLARVVADRKNELPKFFKRYQIQPVWRADRPARGRFREFYQCDVDVIGTKSMVVEAELISAASDVLDRLGFHFTIRINHRNLLYSILESSCIPNELLEASIVALDKFDKIGMTGVGDELLNRGVPKDAYFRFLTFFAKWAEAASALKTAEAKSLPKLSNYDARSEIIRKANETNSELLEIISEFIGNDNYGLEAIEDLKKLLLMTQDTSAAGRMVIDLSLARGLSYYTGTIIEINVPDLAGSLGGGGRYDGLIGMFRKEQIPACGFSLGLERILVMMDEREMFPPEIAESAPADVMVTIWDEDSIAESLKLANELREKGVRVLLYPEPDKLGKQFKYADAIKVPYVCVLGESEVAEGNVTLKHLKSGEQNTISRNDVARAIKAARE